ncbi:MAG TPA: 2-amino-4-hydroxy-6-hydroxymethyldihydropteridine diphosphokinase [Puia sp.]|nr:2-amino-4-hydroxy-6-hydroxymethyldihydropteridine diphosphokinase [Puia sp.]
MNNAYLLTGGNEGNRLFNIKQALANIELFCGEIIQQSSIYETAPWGKKDQPAFLNQALQVQTSVDAVTLMSSLLEIERKMGRIRKEKYGPRIIDIDMLFFNDEILDLPGLAIPHPEIQYRRFVLEPLNEIAPLLMHPVLHKNIHELLKECPDTLEVKKITG